ncbi:hypothetical protein OBBRIDRAFT_849478 [Obba rivulosa]|uniref:Uncharacterized protein n=1 Tax=Obba rivulosa TaxID=1052685 RepID=A0A8E2AT11_9APHY|nr:hypothetical protein OBBRIDRAFT_849478 [Obba rivulosa]
MSQHRGHPPICPLEKCRTNCGKRLHYGKVISSGNSGTYWGNIPVAGRQILDLIGTEYKKFGHQSAKCCERRKRNERNIEKKKNMREGKCADRTCAMRSTYVSARIERMRCAAYVSARIERVQCAASKEEGARIERVQCVAPMGGGDGESILQGLTGGVRLSGEVAVELGATGPMRGMGNHPPTHFALL